MRYFVFSDIHADFDALMVGLKEAEYNNNNPNHQIISCGDNFGRASTGEKSKGIYKYLISKEHINKPICIRGNHETILFDVLQKGYLSYIDICNGEDKSIASFAHCSVGQARIDTYMIEIVIKTGVGEFIKNMPWYYETPNHFFVHSWLPTNHGKYLNNYNRVSSEDWDKATWAITPEKIFKHEELYPNGWNKTIVFGHWGTHLLHNDENNHNIWRNDKLKLIGLDGTTALSHKLNVLVIED